MRNKWIYGLFAAVIILAIGFYFKLPAPSVLAGSTGIHTSSSGAYRILSKQATWDTLSNKSFIIRDRLVNTVVVKTITQSDTAIITLILIPVTNDSVNISWQALIPPQKGIFERWEKYSYAKNLLGNIDNTLENFRTYLQDDENIYGLKILQTSTTDTFLIAKKFSSTTYPPNNLIYEQVSTLQKRAIESGATQVSPPMLNVTRLDTASYQSMVAIPINKIIDDSSSSFFVRMVPGRFLTTTVTGGPFTIAHGHSVMQQYFSDYKRTSMAIPFEYMVTDRIKETDTTKWITKIYGPVY